MSGRKLEQHPVHLDAHGGATAQPAFPAGPAAMQWYEDYAQRTATDGASGRLVSVFAFDRDWDSWEMHPEGEEMVLCLEGRIVLWQEVGEREPARTELGAGDYAINPAGVWHTADVAEPSRALFITPGLDTRHRPRVG